MDLASASNATPFGFKIRLHPEGILSFDTYV
jgi:hypothetical protein